MTHEEMEECLDAAEKLRQAEQFKDCSRIEPIPARVHLARLRECRHPEHKPPGMIVIPAGHRLRHVCPRCGNVQFVYSQRDGLDFLC